MHASTLVADPAGDADVKIEIEVCVECALVPGEAVHDGTPEPVAVTGEDGDESLARIALVHEQRHVELRGNLDLRFEGALLAIPGREVAIEVEPCFPTATTSARERSALNESPLASDHSRARWGCTPAVARSCRG